jgi:hypothetical protein
MAARREKFTIAVWRAKTQFNMIYVALNHTRITLPLRVQAAPAIAGVFFSAVRLDQIRENTLLQ